MIDGVGGMHHCLIDPEGQFQRNHQPSPGLVLLSIFSAEYTLSQQGTVDFPCTNCAKQIRVPSNLEGSQVKCPFCQQIVIAGMPKSIDAQGVPVADDGENLPTLESLQKPPTASPTIELPDELEANLSQLPPSPVANNELSNLIDGVLEQAPNVEPEKEDPTAPIKLDDEDSFYGEENVIGISCQVCDTRIHVRREKIGSTVECPDCFVQVPVFDPKTRKKHWGRGGLAAPEERQNESEGRQDPLRPNPTVDAVSESLTQTSIRQSGGGAAALPSLDEIEIQPVQSSDPEKNNSSAEAGASSKAEPTIAPPAEADLFGGDELRLSDPVELPPATPATGLRPVNSDMLKPKLKPPPKPATVTPATPVAPPSPAPVPKPKPPAPVSTGDDLTLEPLDDNEPLMQPLPIGEPIPIPQPAAEPVVPAPAAPAEVPVVSPVPAPAPASPAAPKPETSSPPTKKKNQTAPNKKSRKERLAEAKLDEMRDEQAGPVPFELPEKEQDFPEFTHSGLVSAVTGMLSSPTLWGLTGLAMVAMIAGAIARIQIFPPGFNLDTAENFGQFVGNATMAILLGVIPYYLGLMLLWTLAAYMFRDAALGRRKVKSWRFNGFQELQGTFLLFAFSFFVAGSVAIFFQPVMIPARMLLAPLFLTAAYFNRSVWAMVAADIFSNFGKLTSQWLTLYIWMAALSGIGVVAGLLFWLRMEDMSTANMVMSFVGVVLNVIATLVFAPIAGWHAGLVCRDLQED